MDKPIVKAEKLTKIFTRGTEKVHAVNSVDIEIYSGDFVALMGSSGSGKTTLLDTIGCLEGISSGRLTVFGKEVSQLKEKDLVTIRRGNISFIFQEFLLIPTLTATENVDLSLYFARREVKGRSQELLKKVGLGHRLDHLPKELSGGERQRVAVARALAISPKLLLADEPTGNLDTKNSQGIYDLFKRLNHEDGLTIVVATHDRALGSQADRVVNLKDGSIIL